MRRAGVQIFIAFFLLISCFVVEPVMSITRTTAFSGIRSQDYNIINSGNPPITSSMLFPNQTAWTNPKIECLIITDASFVSAFQPLADLKTSRGCFTKIITTQFIYSNATFNHTESNDPQPKCAYIRNAIKYYHDAKGTEFIILGGDVNIIPIRYVYNPDSTADFSDSNNMPTDYYYAGLNGTWDANNNGKYGEMKDATNPVDEVDWTPDVFVGRFPVNTYNEANDTVQKDIKYEKNPPNGTWLDTALFASAVSQWQGTSGVAVNEAQLSDFMIDSYFSSMNSKRIYDCTPDYTPDGNYTQLTESNLTNAWGQGAAIVNMAGHGSPTTFNGKTTYGDTQFLSSSDASALTNDGTLPFVYIFSCSSGAFDYYEKGISPSSYSCLAEALVRNQYAGAIAVISAMRTTYYLEIDPLLEALNEGQDRFFWREFFLDQDYQPGRALYLSKLAYIQDFMQKYVNVNLEYISPDYISPYYFRGNLLTYNLLGDPEIYIYTAKPQAFAGNLVNVTEYMGDNLALQIKSASGDVVPNATVLLNGSGYYVVAHADELGLVSLQIPHDPKLVGKNMTITFYGHNMKTTNKTIRIISDTIPPASLHAEIPTGPINYLDQFSINASGIDAGSGLRHAFVVFVDAIGATQAVYPMRIARVSGNETDFRFTYQEPLSPGSTMMFYIVGYDAAGNYIIARATQSQYYSVQIASRTIEDALFYVMVIGAPVAVVVIVIWMFESRKRHRKQLDEVT